MIAHTGFVPAIPFGLRSRIYIAVDEGGDIGSDTEGRWYILCASSVRDRDAFAEATRHFGFVKEMKFRRNGKRRIEVLEMASPALNAVYYVAVRKCQSSFSPAEQKEIHESALRKLSDLILAGESAQRIEVQIDENTLIDDDLAEDIFEKSSLSLGRDIEAEVVDSYENYAMQTHDFIVGSIGKLYNRYDDRYAELLTCPKYSYLTTSDIEKDVSMANRSHSDSVDARRHYKDGSPAYINSDSSEDDCYGGDDE